MIFRPDLVWAGVIAVKHELDVVCSIRNAHIHPTQRFAAARSTPPELLKSENAVVELHRRLEISNHHANMRHVVRNSRRWHEFALVLHAPSVERVFHNLDGMAVRVRNVEVQVLDLALPDLVRHSYALGS